MHGQSFSEMEYFKKYLESREPLMYFHVFSISYGELLLSKYKLSIPS